MWLDEVTRAAESFRSSPLFDEFCPNVSDCTEGDIMRATAGVYYQWLVAQGETRKCSVSQRSEHCDLIYIPPLDYQECIHTGK